METHLRQLSDTTASTLRLLEMEDPEVLGVNLDLCNVAFGGDDPVASIRQLKDRLYFAHIKNGYLRGESYDFRRLDDGIVDYPRVIAELQRIGYQGYLSIECLGEGARLRPKETASHDLDILRRWIGSKI
jgi:sugar phosphate isomerase/epimerase